MLHNKLLVGYAKVFEKLAFYSWQRHFYWCGEGSVFKTIVMFTGELEYSNLPIKFNVSNLENYARYERTGVILTYLYLLLFIFIAIIVLMNLLNAIAIHDAKEIVRNARLLEMQGRVQALVFFEKVNLLLLFLINSFH